MAVQLELWASSTSQAGFTSTANSTAKAKPTSKDSPELAKKATSKKTAAKTTPSRTKKSLPRRDIWAELAGTEGLRSLRLENASATQATGQQVIGPAQEQESAGDKFTALDRLRRQMSALETGGKSDEGPRLSCGVQDWDRLLPGGGLAPGTLVEWVEQDAASGAGWLSLLAAKSLVDSQPDREGRMVVIDTDGTFYPLAAMAAGLSLERLLIVQPANLADGLWAADQALRNPAVSVVWGVLPVLDDRQARRLQLAAEIGETMGLWLRPAKALSEPSWADVRWFVRGVQKPAEVQAKQNQAIHTTNSQMNHSDASRYLETRLVRCRGGRPGTSLTLRIDSSGKVHHVQSKRQTAAMPLVAQLAAPAAAAAAARERSDNRRLA